MVFVLLYVQYNMHCVIIFTNWCISLGGVTGEVDLLVTERLGSLTVSTSDDILLTSTQTTHSFSALLESGLGAEFVWNVTSPHKTAVHKSTQNLGLMAKMNVTFVYPDVYTISVSETL